MQAFQKLAETSLALVITGLVVSSLPSMITPGNCISTMAGCTTTTRAAITIMFVVFGLLTSGA